MKRLFLVLSLFFSVSNCTASEAGSGDSLDIHRAQRASLREQALAAQEQEDRTYQVQLADGSVETITGHFVKQFRTLSSMIEDLENDTEEQIIPLPFVTKNEFIPLYLISTIKKLRDYLQIIEGFTLEELVDLSIAAHHLELIPFDNQETSFDRLQLIIETLSKKLEALDPATLTEEQKFILEKIDSHRTLHNAVIDEFYKKPFKEIKQLKSNIHGKPVEAEYSPDGKTLAILFDYKKILFIDTANYEVLSSFTPDEEDTEMFLVKWLTNDTLLVSLPAGGTLTRLSKRGFEIPDSHVNIPYDDDRPEEMHAGFRGFGPRGHLFIPNLNIYIHEVYYEPDNLENDEGLVPERYLNGCDLRSGKVIFRILNEYRIDEVAASSIIGSPNGMEFMVLCRDHKDDLEEDWVIKIFNTQTGELKKIISNKNYSFTDLFSYSPDGKQIIAQTIAKDNKELLILDVATGKTILKIKNPYEYYSSIASYSPDGNFITIIGDNNSTFEAEIKIKTWNIKSGRLVTNQTIKSRNRLDVHCFNHDGTEFMFSEGNRSEKIILIYKKLYEPKMIAEAYKKKIITILDDLKKDK